jgi:SAM-dependent methyltransferase
MKPQYGVSEAYLGDSGLSYFNWQSQDGRLNAQINAHKFERYIEPQDTVLDFGCGGGYLLAALRCARKIGVEPNPQARTRALGNGVECHPSFAEVPLGVADVGISNHALEHVPCPIDALREFKSRIKPGGRLVVCVPMEDWRVCRQYKPGDINHHLYAWSPQLLGNTLKEAGFEVSPQDIRILTHCFPPRRIKGHLYRRLPRPTFDVLCGICARVLRRRQMVAAIRI